MLRKWWKSISVLESYLKFWSPGNKLLGRRGMAKNWEVMNQTESRLGCLRTKGKRNRTKCSKEAEQDAEVFWPYKPHIEVSMWVRQFTHTAPKVHQLGHTGGRRHTFKIAGQERKSNISWAHTICKLGSLQAIYPQQLCKNCIAIFQIFRKKKYSLLKYCSRDLLIMTVH